MARQQVVMFTDDVTGKPMTQEEATTVQVVAHGRCYTLDISGDTFRKMVEPLIGKASDETRAPGGGIPLPRNGSGAPAGGMTHAAKREQLKFKREWWAENWERAGLPRPTTDRGRIPENVIAAYERYKGAAIPLPAPKSAPAKVTFAAAEDKRPATKSVRPAAKAPAKVAAPVAARARKPRVTK